MMVPITDHIVYDRLKQNHSKHKS